MSSSYRLPKLLDGMEQRDVMEQQPHQGPQPSIGASNGLGWKMTAPPMHQPLYGKILGKTNYPPSRGSAIRDHSYSVTAEVFRNAPGAAFRPNFEAHEAELAFPSADQVPASHLFHQVSTFSQPDGMQNFLDALSTSATAPNTNEWANLKSPESWEVFANDYADRNSVFVSCPQQNLTHAFEAGSKPVQAPPIAAKIAFDQRSTGERMLVQTIHGPALLLTEQSFYAPVSTLNMATASPKSPPVSRRRKFQRWSYEEDDLLKQAVEIEGQPPYNWIKIAKKYFSNSRTGVQCKSRWTKVSLFNI